MKEASSHSENAPGVPIICPALNTQSLRQVLFIKGQKFLFCIVSSFHMYSGMPVPCDFIIKEKKDCGNEEIRGEVREMARPDKAIPMRRCEQMAEAKTKITLEGEGEYINSIRNMKSSVMEFRKEIEQLNTALEKEIELLKKLG